VPLTPAAGVNVTLIMHVPPLAATFAPLVQVVPVAIAKSAAPVPEIAGAGLSVNAAVPVFVTVTDWAALVVVTNCPVKVRVDAEIIATGAAAMAVPVMVSVWGLVAALSVSVSVAVREPVAVAVNVTLIMQVPPLAATVEPLVQVVPVAIAKSPALAPLSVGAAVKFKIPAPEFVTVTERAGLLVVPTG
jgi:hypothetical protein